MNCAGFFGIITTALAFSSSHPERQRVNAPDEARQPARGEQGAKSVEFRVRPKRKMRGVGRKRASPPGPAPLAKKRGASPMIAERRPRWRRAYSI